jgi:MoaA/NifB/PqqE/SkfB family radical SAM enzyme
MQIIRSIGKHEIAVETDEAMGIAITSDLAQQIGLAPDGQVGRKQLLSALSSGDEYYPLTCQWELLDKCNFACPFCYIVGHSSHRVVRFSEISDHLADLVDAGLLFCTLTGGEVMLHPDFAQIYSFLKSRGVVVEVFTNGLAIDDETVDLFRSLPPSSVEISLYSLDNHKLRDIYGVKNPSPASRVLENVLRLKDAGIQVVCKTFLNAVTEPDFDALVSWCDANAIEHYSSSNMTQAYDGENLDKFKSKARAAPSMRRTTEAVCLPCKTKNYGSAINAAFQIFSCPTIRLADCTYDIRTHGVPEALSKMLQFMRRFQDTEIQGVPSDSNKCASCIAFAKPIRTDSGEISHFSQW